MRAMDSTKKRKREASEESAPEV